MTVNEALSRLSEKDDKASYRQPVSEVSYNAIRKLSPSDTFIYQMLQRESRGDRKCRVWMLKNLKHEKNL